jgi:hypothetical protein
MELKYFLLREYLSQNYEFIDIFLMRQMFDIKYYLIIMFAYYNDAIMYTNDIDTIYNAANKLIFGKNLQTCENNDEDIKLLDLIDSRHGSVGKYKDIDIKEAENIEKLIEKITTKRDV